MEFRLRQLNERIEAPCVRLHPRRIRHGGKTAARRWVSPGRRKGRVSFERLQSRFPRVCVGQSVDQHVQVMLYSRLDSMVEQDGLQEFVDRLLAMVRGIPVG